MRVFTLLKETKFFGENDQAVLRQDAFGMGRIENNIKIFVSCGGESRSGEFWSILKNAEETIKLN